MKTKQEAIKAAYGEFWERLSPFQQEYALSENGTVQIGYTEEQKKLFSDIRKIGLFNVKPTMPKSLSGIGTNNGWTRIESEEDIPKGNGFAGFLLATVDKVSSSVYNYKEVEFYFKSGIYTHYQPIEVPKPPIF